MRSSVTEDLRMSALPNHDDLVDAYDEELELEIEDRDASGYYTDASELFRQPVPADMIVPEVY